MNLGRFCYFFGIGIGSSVYEYISVLWLTVCLAVPFCITPLIILILSQFDWFNSGVDIVSLRSVAIGYNFLVLLNTQNYWLIVVYARQSICAFILLRLKLFLLLLRGYEIVYRFIDAEDLTLVIAFYNHTILWIKNIIHFLWYILAFQFLTQVVHLDWISDLWRFGNLKVVLWFDEGLPSCITNDGWRYNILLYSLVKINLFQFMRARQLLHDGVIVDISDLLSKVFVHIWLVYFLHINFWLFWYFSQRHNSFDVIANYHKFFRIFKVHLVTRQSWKDAGTSSGVKQFMALIGVIRGGSC